MLWLAIVGFAAAAVWVIARVRRNFAERDRRAEARAAELLASISGGTAPAPAAPPAPIATPAEAAVPPAKPLRAPATDELAQQKLLFESAHKAGEAGEPALAIQLYARLLARYPATAFAQPARNAVEAQKKKLLPER